jgi:hypothetical protein
MVYAEDMNLLQNDIDTIKRNRETLNGASKEAVLEVNGEKTEYTTYIAVSTSHKGV